VRVFITGATGFIGAALTGDLIAAGHQVLGLTRSEEGARARRAGGAAVVGVILNLAIWFALHVLFRQMFEVRRLGLALELPVLSTVNIASAVLALTAAVAAFRFKVGVIPLLLGCSAVRRPACSITS
jgi:nucleoside-diphosphate-sugar epimerase